MNAHIPVVPGTYGALLFKLVIKTALMEGVLTEKVDGRQRETSSTQATLHHLKDLGTKERMEREREERDDSRVRFSVFRTQNISELLLIQYCNALST